MHVGKKSRPFMINEALIEQLNRGYVCPADAGPAWRAACEYGFDMSLVEDALSKSVEQRIEDHQRALNLALEIQAARHHEDPGAG